MKLFVFTLSALLLTGLFNLEASDTKLNKQIWQMDLQKAHALAQQHNKPMVIVFGANWCKFCKKLEDETLSDPALEKYIRDNFIPVYLDLDEQTKVGRILEIKSLPSTVVLSPSADLLGKTVGYKTAAAMQEQLEKALQTDSMLRQASGEKAVK